MKTLRDYQLKAVNDIQHSWEHGHKNLLMVLPTGSGKSLVISEVLKKHKGNSIVCAHRSEIICPLSLTLAKNGEDPALKMLLFKDDVIKI